MTLLQAARKNHGVECRDYKRMDPATGSFDCANCGRSTTAHVVTKLADELEATRHTGNLTSLDRPPPRRSDP